LRLTSPVLSVINDGAREVVRCKSIIPLGVGVGPSEYEYNKFKINKNLSFFDIPDTGVGKRKKSSCFITSSRNRLAIYASNSFRSLKIARS